MAQLSTTVQVGMFAAMGIVIMGLFITVAHFFSRAPGT